MQFPDMKRFTVEYILSAWFWGHYDYGEGREWALDDKPDS